MAKHMRSKFASCCMIHAFSDAYDSMLTICTLQKIDILAFYCTRKSPVDECFFRLAIGSKSMKHGSAIVRLTFGDTLISRYS